MKKIIIVVIIATVFAFAKNAAQNFTASTKTAVNNHHAMLRNL